jgi:hypothetical protein
MASGKQSSPSNRGDGVYWTFPLSLRAHLPESHAEGLRVAAATCEPTAACQWTPPQSRPLTGLPRTGPRRTRALPTPSWGSTRCPPGHLHPHRACAGLLEHRHRRSARLRQSHHRTRRVGSICCGCRQSQHGRALAAHSCLRSVSAPLLGTLRSQTLTVGPAGQGV